MLIATHDLGLIKQFCHRAILLKEGRLLIDGLIGEVLADSALLERCNL
jgi:ABC-type polysaccharide/polyol phosphate transport system ATPase subunit